MSQVVCVVVCVPRKHKRNYDKQPEPIEERLDKTPLHKIWDLIATPPASLSARLSVVLAPRETNLARTRALSCFKKAELKQLSLRRHLVGRLGPDGPELGLAVGQPDLGCHVTDATHVVRLLERLAEEGLRVRHLDRPGIPKGQNWRVRDVSAVVKSAASASLRSAKLSYLHLNAKGYARLGSGNLSGLRELDLGASSLDADKLTAFGDGNWPMLERLVLGSVTATADQVLGLIDALPALRALRLEGWAVKEARQPNWRPSRDDFRALVTDPRFATLEAFHLMELLEVSDDDVLDAFTAAENLRLTSLFGGIGGDGDAMGRFLETPLAKQLRELSLDVAPSSLPVLAEVGLPALERLDCVAIAGCDPDKMVRFIPDSLVALTLAAGADVAVPVLEAAKRLSELTLSKGSLGLELDEVFSAVERCPSAPHLTSLTGVSVPNSALAALAAAPLDSLRSLHLKTSDRWTQAAVIELATAPWAGGLYELGLEGRGFGDALGDTLANALAARRFNDLGLLNVQYHRFTRAGIEALAMSEGFPELHTLDLRIGPGVIDGGIDHQVFKLLVDPKRHPHIQSLCIPHAATDSSARKARPIYEHPSAFVICSSYRGY